MRIHRCHVPVFAFLSGLLGLGFDAPVNVPPDARVTAENQDLFSALPDGPSAIPDFGRYIAAASREHGVSEELIRAIIKTESEFDPKVVSGRGACGLMQLMPLTAKSNGVVDCKDARENIRGGTRYLKSLLKRYGGSVSLSVAAYNAGETAVARHRGIPPFRQTRAYVRKVEALLYAEPPPRRPMTAS
jgi:soluble lytic murein transglycosylase-like protein